MAWFRNHYRCGRCGLAWTDEWSAMCDDDCPHCGARHFSPLSSDDLTVIVRSEGASFAVLRSPDTAEDDPDYQVVARFTTKAEADAAATIA